MRFLRYVIMIILGLVLSGIEGRVRFYESGNQISEVRSVAASFGRGFRNGETYKANLFLTPKEDSVLCNDSLYSRSRDLAVTAKHESLNIDDPIEKTIIDPSPSLEEYWIDIEVDELHRVLSTKSEFEDQLLAKADKSRRNVALLVKRGKCSFLEKAKNAQRINRKFEQILANSSEKDNQNIIIPRIKYLFVYNYERSDEGIVTDKKETLIMGSDGADTSDVNDIGLLFISFESSVLLKKSVNNRLEKLDFNDTDHDYSPYLDLNKWLSGKVSNWFFPVIFNGEGGYGIRSSLKSPQLFDFYEAFRIILVSLLVIIPFARTSYLWYLGGGRILFRRNPETNRINGITVVRPRTRWLFGAQRYHDNVRSDENGSNQNDYNGEDMKLTKEEVLALPETSYSGSGDHTASSTMASQTNSSGDIQEGKILTNNDDNKTSTSSSNDIYQEETCKINGINCNNIVANEADIESSSHLRDRNNSKPLTHEKEESLPSVETATISMDVCSICIDDFEQGETLRLLPCGHYFHTECIMPWLTERCGSCPLCKRPVKNNTSEGE